MDSDGTIFLRKHFRIQKSYRTTPAQLVTYAQRVEKAIGKHLATLQLYLLRH